MTATRRTILLCALVLQLLLPGPPGGGTGFALAGSAPVKGLLSLRTTPAGARTFVNGRLVGKTPIRQQITASSGPLKIEIRAPGYVTEVCNVQPDQLRRGLKLYFELTPLPPADQCAGSQGDHWLKWIDREPLSPETLDSLRRCFTREGNWRGVEVTALRQLERGSSSLLLYDLARAHYQQGSTDHYARCVQESGKALRLGQLDRCLRWRAQHLRIVCLLNYEHRGWRNQPVPGDAPQAGELLVGLRNDLENLDPQLPVSPAERQCHEEMQRELARLEGGIDP